MRRKGLKIAYDPKYAVQMVEWFKNAPLYETEVKEVYNKKCDKFEETVLKNAVPCPSFVRFADENGLPVEVFEIWRNKYPDFAEAYHKAKMFQEDWLMNAAGLGFYNSSMSIMALKANHGWVEKQETRAKTKAELKQVLVRFVKDEEPNNHKKELEIEENNSEDSGDFCAADDDQIPD